jgi:hypothetical protein
MILEQFDPSILVGFGRLKNRFCFAQGGGGLSAFFWTRSILRAPFIGLSRTEFRLRERHARAR